MPLYEYHCKTCASTFDVMRPMGQVPVEERCPEGHGGAAKVLSTFATVTGSISGDECAADFTDMGCGSCGSAVPGACAMN